MTSRDPDSDRAADSSESVSADTNSTRSLTDIVRRACRGPTTRRSFMRTAATVGGGGLALSAGGGTALADQHAADGGDARMFTVIVENVSTPGTIDSDRADGVVPLSPPVYAAYSGENPAFTVGEPANEGTEIVAEDGFPTTLVETLGAADNVSASGVAPSPGGSLDGPPLGPGESVAFGFTASPGDKLTMETMFVQSNDWFYGFESLELFDGDDPVSGDVTGRLGLYDAGTEADTPPGTGPDQKPVQDPDAIDVGPDEDEPVRLAAERHPDFDVPATDEVIRVTVRPAQTFTVTVENVSTPGTVDTDRANGVVPLSPPVYAVYSGENPAFVPGELANEGTEIVAEDGFPTTLVETLGAADNVSASGVAPSPGGAIEGPPLGPDESVEFSVTASPGDLLTMETMFVQSNDWFYGFEGLPLFDGADPISGDVTDRIAVYDAGTEVDAPPGHGPTSPPGAVQKLAQDPMATDVGTAESVPIQLASERHPDFDVPADDEVIRVTVTPEDGDAPPAVVGDARPTDPDGDGRYEDVNGDGESTYMDIVDLFDNFESDAVRDNPDAYDFNGNGRLEYDDVVEFFESM